MTPKHSPLPWGVDRQLADTIASKSRKRANDGYIIAEFYGPDAKANAAHVALTANLFPEMVEVLARVAATSWHDPRCPASPPSGDEPDCRCGWSEIEDRARALLQKAKEAGR